MSGQSTGTTGARTSASKRTDDGPMIVAHAGQELPTWETWMTTTVLAAVPLVVAGYLPQDGRLTVLGVGIALGVVAMVQIVVAGVRRRKSNHVRT